MQKDSYRKGSFNLSVMRQLAKLKVCSESHNVPKIGYFAIIILYVVFSRITATLSNSLEVVNLGDQTIPLSSLAGATSSFSSMLIILLVVFYGHLGFYTATAIICYRLFVLVNVIFVSHNFPTIPGLFTNFVTFMAIALIQRRNNRIDKFKESELSHLKEQQKFSKGSLSRRPQLLSTLLMPRMSILKVILRELQIILRRSQGALAKAKRTAVRSIMQRFFMTLEK